MKPTIEDVIDLLQQVRQNEPADNHNIWKQRFEWLAEELERHKADARDLLEEYTEQGLKLGTIEAEGALRSAITAATLVQYVLDNTKEDGE